MEYTSDVETCIDMIKYEMFCVEGINLVKMKSDKLIICCFFTVMPFLDLTVLRTKIY